MMPCHGIDSDSNSDLGVPESGVPPIHLFLYTITKLNIVLRTVS